MLTKKEMLRHHEPICYREIRAGNDKTIAQLTLHAETTLNALSLPMVESLQALLDQLQEREDVAMVLLDSAGDRAFCAGGDLKRLSEDACFGDQGREFFSKEYRLDFSIHNYPKPIVAWGAGIVMGGGLGLLGAASHRIVTETSNIAMPEISIGLYPDVGGSLMLSKAPPPFGLFMGITGCSINAADALELGLADFIIDNERKNQMIQNFIEADWRENAHTVVHRVAHGLAECSKAQSTRMMARREIIQPLCRGNTLSQIVERFAALETEDDFLAVAKSRLLGGCPMSACLVWEQIKRTPSLTLAEIFQMEWVMSVNCLTRPDFPEGVRALIIDKDRQPKWQHRSIEDVSVTEIQSMFRIDEKNPLQNIMS